jgi:hypothetical protein
VRGSDSRRVAIGARNLVIRAGLLALALGCLAGSGAAQGVSGVGLTRAKGQQLVIEVNGQTLVNYLSMALPDTVVVTVNPRDSLGNPLAVTGFEVQVWDQSVLLPAGSSVEATRAVARFVPRKRGQTTIQIRSSGVRQWIRVEVGPTILAVVPLRNAPAPAQPGARRVSTPTAGGRVSFAAYEHTFNQQTTFDAKNGFVAEAYLGRDFFYGTVLVGGVGFGLLQADSLNVSVTAHLLEAYFRVDYVFLEGKVSPVVSAGGGAYRLRTGGEGSGIWNTSLYWMLGMGVDVTLSPKMSIEFRATTQQLEEVNSGSLNGHVGNLLVIGAGLRFRF